MRRSEIGKTVTSLVPRTGVLCRRSVVRIDPSSSHRRRHVEMGPVPWVVRHRTCPSCGEPAGMGPRRSPDKTWRLLPRGLAGPARRWSVDLT